MIESLFAKLGAIILAPVLAIAGFFSPAPEAPIGVGTALPEAVAIFETSLAAPITANATTMTLTANSIRGGGALSGFNCFTVDEGSAQAEFICGTVSETTVTGLTRGISPADGITEDTDLQFSHRRGANVKITDFPIIQRLKIQNSGEGTFENALSYAAGVAPSGNNHLTDVEYVLSVVNGGSVSFDQEIVTGNAGETVATGTVVYRSLADGEWYKADSDVADSFTDRLIGIAQGAGTNGNAISGGVLISGVDSNQSGLTTDVLYFLSSTAGGVQTATSTQMIGVAKSGTELIVAPQILDTYNGYSTTYAGSNTFTGSSTVVSSATTTFSGFVDFTGTLSGHASTTYTVYTASTTWAKPAGLERIEVWVCGGGGGGDSTISDDHGGGGGGGGCAYEELTAAELSATTSVSIVVGLGGAAQTAGQTSSFGNFLSATGGSFGTGSAGGSAGIGSGGDLNIGGSDGAPPAGDSAGEQTGGNGGSSHFGGGGKGGIASNGGNGLQYGGGGGGAADTSSSNNSGGAGAQGVVIIKTFF